MKKANGWITGIVQVWDIPTLRIHLKSSFCQEMMYNLKKFGNYTQIAKIINEPIGKYGCAYSFSNLKRNNSGTVSLIYKISNFLLKKGNKQFNRSNIESNIIAISTRGMKKNMIINPKIPFDFTTESGCILLSALLHDGGIDSKLYPHYWNIHVPLRKKVFKASQEVFGEFPSKFKEFSEGFHLSRTCGKILVNGLGLMPGKKVFTNPSIPYFIFKLSKKKTSLFLRQAFDDDGSFGKTGARLELSISGKENPPHLLVQIKNLLNMMNIETSKPSLIVTYTTKKDGMLRSKWAITLTGRDNLRKFLESVNFSIPYKKEKLYRYLAEVSEEHFKYHQIEKEIIKAIKCIDNKKGYFTRKMIANEINRGWSRIQQIFPKLINNRTIIQISKCSGNKPAKFKLGEKH